MLAYGEREYYERAVLSVFLEHVSIGYVLVNKLKKEHFSSEIRQLIFQYILDEKKAGRKIILERINHEGAQAEIIECMKGSIHHLANLENYIKLLQEDGFINDLYNLGTTLQDLAVNDASHQNMIDQIEKVLSLIVDDDTDEFVITMENAITMIDDGTLEHKEYPIGWKTIDEYTPVSSQSITIIGGNQGTFKTKLMIYIMRALLFQYSNISVLWYSMEDPADKIIRGFISQSTGLTDKELKKIDYSSLIPDDVKKYDIEFVTKSSTIKDIGIRFTKFKSTREDKFCILIVDNLMKIIPMDKRLDPDIEILREVESWNVKTSIKEQSVYLLHHFTKAALDDKNQSNAYMPKISHLRGSGRYADAVTNALLVNPMYSYRDIIDAFKGYEEFLEHYYVALIAKNRNDKKAVMRMIAFPSSNEFYEL